MKIENSPKAYGLLAGLLVLLFGMFVNGGCASPTSHTSSPGVERASAQQAETAVAIFTECGAGSGVLVDARHVLTAFHVVRCDSTRLASHITIRMRVGELHVVAIDVTDPDRDLARLVLSADARTAPVTIRPARVKENVCAATAIPERAFRCGVVDGIGSTPRGNGDVFVAGANVWYGNSGSGVYGADGALVGILVRLRFCNATDAFFSQFGERPITCGGFVTSITDSPVNL